MRELRYFEAVSEALVFASKAGCDPASVREALMGGFAGLAGTVVLANQRDVLAHQFKEGQGAFKSGARTTDHDG